MHRTFAEPLESRLMLTAVSQPLDLPVRVGVNFPSWWHDEFLGQASDARLTKLFNNTDANTIEIVPTWYMSTKTSNSVDKNVNKSVDDNALLHVITQAKAAGISIVLKPHVDVLDDSAWRGAIAPTDTNAWFNSYKSFINHYAQIAKDQNIDMLCVGTELKSMNGSNFTTQWNSVIDGIESIYAGKLTYAANWDDFSNVKFWNRLDVIGIDQYNSLGQQNVQENTPDVATLVQRWQPIVTAISGWRTQQGFSQHVMMTEIGYRAVPDAHRTWMSNSTTYDPAAQQRCYEAATQVWTSQDWMDGLLWWAWTNDVVNYEHSPLDKPAQNAMSTGSISGTLFNDTNGNGVKDGSESGLSNWKIYLDVNNNNALDAGEYSVNTNASGQYAINNLLVGNYLVRAQIQSGYRKTTPGAGSPGYNVSLASAQSVSNQNFGVSRTVLLYGVVYNDANQSETKDVGEVGLSGWRVYIDLNNNGTFDAGESAKTSDASGNYKFGALQAGTGVLRVEDKAGWIDISPPTGSYSGTVSAGQIVPNVNFGVNNIGAAPIILSSIEIMKSVRRDNLDLLSDKNS